MEENNNREGEDGLENCNNIGTQFSQWDNQTTQNIINQFMLLSLNEQTNIGEDGANIRTKESIQEEFHSLISMTNNLGNMQNMRVKCLYIRNKEDGNKSVDHILNNQDYSNREIITDEEMKEMNEETNSLSNSPTQKIPEFIQEYMFGTLLANDQLTKKVLAFEYIQYLKYLQMGLIDSPHPQHPQGFRGNDEDDEDPMQD